MLKKFAGSKVLRICFSLILIYFAFKRVDVVKLLSDLSMVPLWFVVAMLVYFSISMILGGVRWSYLVLAKPKWVDFWNFTKATYFGAFYSLFFPTAVVGDLLKWMPLLKKYQDLSKTKLASSVLIDRVIGFSAFTLVGFIALIAGRLLNYSFPNFLFWLFGSLTVGVGIFYLIVFSVNFDNILEKIFGKVRFLRKILDVIDLLKSENKNRILKVFLISLIGEPVWMLPVWFYSLLFKVGVSLLEVYIFIPVISLILVLPISIAGFGARENLYLYFFGTLGLADDKILLMSTFGGILGILNSLIGGLMLIF